MSEVYIKNASYDYDLLKPAVFEMIDSIGTVRIQKQSRVLIKPNFLLPAVPEKAVLTHPLVVKAVAEYVLSKGGCPLIADSPAMGSIKKIFREGGYEKALKGLDVEFGVFQSTVSVDVGEPFGRIDIAREAIETDIVINLPKLKTHAMMLLTLGVKNLFGCIVGLKKPEWHFRAGIDKALFANLLVRISNAVNPTLTLVDGILAMEGQGPGKGGTPRHLGILVGGADPLAVDSAVCKILGIDPQILPTVKEAIQSGTWNEAIHIRGDFFEVMDFIFPVQGPATFGSPSFQRFMRQYLLSRPSVNLQQCRLCGKCWQYCPAKAVVSDGKKIIFNYDTCIRCYCCVEVCPHGVLRVEEPLPGKLLGAVKTVVDRFKSSEPN